MDGKRSRKCILAQHMGILVCLHFLECVPVLGLPCSVDSELQGQALFLYVWMLFIPISISMFLLAVKFCWLCVFYWCYLYSIFCIWVHPGILNPPLEFLGYSHNFCLVLVKKQLFLLCNCTLESAQPGSHFIHHSVLTSSFLSPETRSMCQRNTTFYFAKSKMVVEFEHEDS